MNICEAVSEALRLDLYVARQKWRGFAKIQPTNLYDCCRVICKDDKIPHPRWQPRAEDLIADDWVLVS